MRRLIDATCGGRIDLCKGEGDGRRFSGGDYWWRQNYKITGGNFKEEGFGQPNIKLQVEDGSNNFIEEGGNFQGRFHKGVYVAKCIRGKGRSVIIVGKMC